jgi:hypothetical protein
MNNITGFIGECGDIQVNVGFGFEIDSQSEISCSLTEIGVDVALNNIPTSVYSVEYEVRQNSFVRKVQLKDALFYLKHSFPALNQYKVDVIQKVQSLGSF